MPRDGVWVLPIPENQVFTVQHDIDAVEGMQKDPDGYVLFNSDICTLKDAFEHAGYVSVISAAQSLSLNLFYDHDGNYNGDIAEGKLLYNHVLKPTAERRNEYLDTYYSNIRIAEIISSLFVIKSNGGTSTIEAVGEFAIGELLGKLPQIGSFINFLLSLVTNTQDSLGITGEQLFIADLKKNNQLLRAFRNKERVWGYRENILHNFSFGNREIDRVYTDSHIVFNFPYIDL
jgi:hypothetical protein